MDSITKLSPSISLSDIGDTVSQLPFDRVIDVFEHVTPDIDDITEVATAMARKGRRVGTRTVRTSYRIIRRNPQTAVGILAGLIAATAIVLFIKKRRSKQADVHLKAAA